LRGELHLAAFDKIHRRIADDPIAWLDPGVHFHLRAEITGHVHLGDLRLAIVDHRDLQAVTVEDEGVVGIPRSDRSLDDAQTI
jgi:hypothetical protein